MKFRVQVIFTVTSIKEEMSLTMMTDAGMYGIDTEEAACFYVGRFVQAKLPDAFVKEVLVWRFS